MKRFFIFLFLFVPFCSWAGDKILNGGNTVVCNVGGKINSVELLDYYELRLNGGVLNLGGGSYSEILKNLFSRWEKIAPKRIALYRGWLNEFPKDSSIYSDISIPPIPDTGSVAIPTGCELRPIGFQRPDEEILPGVKRYVISKDLWDLMPEAQKAGLILHEFIYREGIKAKHKTSFPTRYFNGYLSSAIPKTETYAYIVSKMPLLWVEYGGGMILESSSITEDGHVNAMFREVIGDVVSDGFSIIGYIRNSGGRIYYDGKNFFGSMYVDKNPIKLIIKIEVANFELPLFGPSSFNIYAHAGLYSSSYPLFWTGGDCSSDLNVDPNKNWLKRKDGTLISSIKTMNFLWDDENRVCYPQKLRTVSGEIWTWDSNKRDYFKK